MLAVLQTHPVQYHAPVFRAVQQHCGIPVTAIYGSDFSIAGYQDAEFGTRVAWDTDLVSGYTPRFLGRVSSGGPRHFAEVSSAGIAAALDELQPDAVMVTGYSPAFHRSAFLAAWRRGLPILFRAETTTSEPASPLKRAARRAALRAFYARCAAVLYIGERARRHYDAYGVPAERLVRSPYCVDTSVFKTSEAERLAHRASLRATLGFSDDTLVLLQSGKLTSKKRPDLLLEAVRTLPDRLGRTVGVILLGDGELRPGLEATAQSLHPTVVHVTGFRNQRELSPWYHAADLLVLPSQHSETWGLVVNEALAHGLPAVVSDAVGCADDLVEPGLTGDVFQTGSAEGLAHALVRAQALAGLAATRERCRALERRYNVEAAAEGVAAAYRMVTGAAR